MFERYSLLTFKWVHSLRNLEDPELGAYREMTAKKVMCYEARWRKSKQIKG